MSIFISGIDLTEPKRVLLVSEDELILEDIVQIKRILAERFPNSEFIILNGGFKAVIVAPNTPSYDFEVDDE